MPRIPSFDDIDISAADRKIDKLLSVRASLPDSPTLTRPALAALSEQLLARLRGDAVALFDRYEAACVEHEHVAIKVGYILGVKAGRRHVGGAR